MTPINVAAFWLQWSAGALLAILVLAAVIERFLPQSSPKTNFADIRLQVRTWWVTALILASVLAGAIFTGWTLAFTLIGFVCFIALKEYFTIIPTRRADRYTLLLAYLSIPVQLYWAGLGWFGMFVVFIPVLVILMTVVRVVRSDETNEALKSSLLISGGVLIAVFGLSHLAVLLILPDYRAAMTGSIGPALFLILLTLTYSITDYVLRKLVGKHKFIFHRSWEDTLGSFIIIVILASFLGPMLTPLSGWLAFVAGLIIALGSFAGDVTVAMFKRKQGLPESGPALPGHGGVLNQVGSLIYSAPLFFYFMLWLL